MKKFIMTTMAAVTLIACHIPKDHDGIYIAHIKGEYSVADDTLIVEGNYVTKRTGYQKIRHGKLLPKGFKTRTWLLNSEDAPPVRFTDSQLILVSTTYTKQP